MSFFKKKNEQYHVIVDIGSSSVGVALTQISQGGRAHVLWAAREDMVFQIDLNFGRFFDAMCSALDKSLSRFAALHHDVPKNFLVSFASPWYVAQTRIVRVGQGVPFTVTKKGVAKLIEREVEAFRNYRLPNYQRVVEEATEVLEAQSIQIKLNGYDVADPYGISAKEMVMAVYVSMSPQRVLDAVGKVITRHFHRRSVTFHSFPLVAFSTIRDIFVEAKDFLFLDISGEVTDVSIIRDDALLETVSFPLGKNFLIRRMINALNTVPEEAVSLLRLYTAGDADEATKRKIQTVLIAARNEWLKLFTEVLGNLSKNLPLPHRVFFTADDDVAKWFSEAIQHESLRKYIFTDEPFQVTIFDTPILSGFSSVAAETLHDPFLLLESMFAAKTGKHISK
ncbi:MAG: hypothetical protein ACYC8S_03310 [Minisyncoccota bacterium]